MPAFCEKCGGPVYSSAVENVRTYSLRVGALEQRDEVQKLARQDLDVQKIGLASAH